MADGIDTTPDWPALAGAHTLDGLEPARRIGCITIEPSARRLSVDDRVLDLTAAEYDIVACLVRAAGRIVSRDDIMSRVFAREAHPVDRALDVHISRVRHKLGHRRSLILTIRGLGYMLRVDPPMVVRDDEP